MAKKQLLVFTCIISLILISATPGTSRSAEGKVNLRVIDSGSTSSTMAYCVALNQLMAKHSERFEGEAFPTKGYPESLYFLLSGRGDICTADEITMIKARNGEKEFKTLGKRTDIRILSNLSALFMHAVVLADSDIKSLSYEQLKGKTIATRQPGSVGGGLSLAYITAMGIDYKKDVKMLYMSAADCTRAVSDGTADMYMAIHGPPSGAVLELSETKPCRLIPFPKELTNKVGRGLHTKKIAAGVYKGQDEAIESAVLYGYWVTLESFDADYVYELMKLWWENVDERNEVHPAIKKFGTVENLKEAIGFTETKLHEGAKKYYLEKGWIEN